MEVGTRVGAIASATNENVDFFGYGVYLGEQIPTEEENETFAAFGVPNPKIQLDNGNIVWGFECWWGPEEKIREKIGDRKVTIVS